MTGRSSKPANAHHYTHRAPKVFFACYLKLHRWNTSPKSSLEKIVSNSTSNCTSSACHISYCSIITIFRMESWMAAKDYNDFKLASPEDPILPLQPIFCFARMRQYGKFSKARNISLQLLTGHHRVTAVAVSLIRYRVLCPHHPSLTMDAGTHVWLGIVLSFN